MNFADRLCLSIRDKGPLMVGLDPHLEYCPPFLLEKEIKEKGKTWEALSSAVAEMNRLLLEVLQNIVAMVKIQMAFYEMLGVPGMVALKSTIDFARQLGFIIILDGKRNDISSTASAYARGYLSQVPFPGGCFSSFWDIDALTVNPYLGEDGLEPFIDEARAAEKGIFVLCRTSNPSSPTVQDVAGPEKVFVKVASMVEAMGKKLVGESGFSSVGIVVGATYPDDVKYLRERFPTLLFLLPGIGTQKGSLECLRFAFREDGLGAVVNVSRDVVFAYRDDPQCASGIGFEVKARERAKHYQTQLRDLLP